MYTLRQCVQGRVSSDKVILLPAASRDRLSKVVFLRRAEQVCCFFFFFK